MFPLTVSAPKMKKSATKKSATKKSTSTKPDPLSAALLEALSFPDHKPLELDEELELPDEFVYEPSNDEFGDEIPDDKDPREVLILRITIAIREIDEWYDEWDNWDSLDEELEKKLEKIRPVLPKKASKKACLAAIQKFKRQHAELVQVQRKQFVDMIKPLHERSGMMQARLDSYKEELEELTEALKAELGVESEAEESEEESDEDRVYSYEEAFVEVFHDEDADDWDSDEEGDIEGNANDLETLDRTRRRLRHWREVLDGEERHDTSAHEKRCEIIARRAHDLFHKHVLAMVEGQSEELVEWITQSSSGHLDKKETVRSPRMMKERPGSGSTALPWEITAMIYSYCDLETCVKLREVSTAWYNAYQLAERALELNVQERFPWMRPEGETETWGDCALVFLARVGSDKWEDMYDFLMCVYSGTPKDYRPRTLIAEELARGEKLPSNFQGLHEHHDDNECSDECEMVHLNSGFCFSDILNPWTLVSEPCTQEQWKKVSCSKEGNVFKYRDVEVTLPPRHWPIKERDNSGDEFPADPVTLNRHSIVVRTKKSIFMFDRENPHYEHALNYNEDEGSVELRDIFIVKFPADNGDIHFTLCDPLAQDMHQFGGSLSADYEPVAFYQGLLWWYACGTIIPTFFDLAKSAYSTRFRKDRSFKVAFGDHQKFRQCSRAPHLLVRNLRAPGQGIELVDLSTGIVTQVNAPGEAYIIPGYVDGKFQAKYMSYDTLESYIRL